MKGENMFLKRQHFLREYDWIRKGLMFEPRGHDMMSGSILYPPSDPQNDIGVLFIETSGCLPMCGHGIIGTVTIAVEKGLVKPKIPGKMKVETPAGLINVTYRMEKGKVHSVKLINVPSYLALRDVEYMVPGLGKLNFDVGYGGNFYGIIDVQENFKGIEHYRAEQLINWSRMIRDDLREKLDLVHPENSEIKGLSHIMWSGTPLDSQSNARNAVFYGDKAIDRSPCGTGTSARMAQWYGRGKLKKGDTFIHESIIGSVFKGTVEEEVEIGNYQGIVPGIEGWARIYGRNTIVIDESDDPYALGFQVI